MNPEFKGSLIVNGLKNLVLFYDGVKHIFLLKLPTGILNIDLSSFSSSSVNFKYCKVLFS